jgi:hypothetical protein
VPTRALASEPNTTIGELIGRLTDDSKRLVSDEVRLAKLEVGENVKQGAKGAAWMAAAFGVGVVALVALTIFLAAAIGRLVNGNYWVGALVTGLVEVAAGAWLIKRGVGAFGGTSYTLGESREELSNTAAWISRETRA